MTIDDQAASTVLGAPAPESPVPAAPAPGHQRRRPRPLLTAGALLVALAFGSAGTYIVTRADAGATAATAEAGYTEFADPAAGFRIAYPANWKRVSGPEGLLLEISAQNAVGVKKTTLAEAVDTSNIAAVRAVTDAVLSKPDAKLEILNSNATEVGGLPGIYYLYSFQSGNDRGAHTHYFVFDGRDMFTLVFQALPAADFASLAPTFDKVVASFGVLKG